MLKMMYLKSQELSDVLAELISKSENQEVFCEVGYSEELDTDAVTVRRGEEKEDIAIETLLEKIGTHFNESIQSYDVIEVGDHGEGFTFMIN